MSSKLLLNILLIAHLTQIAVTIKCYQGTYSNNTALPPATECPTGAVSCQKSVTNGMINRQCNFQPCAALTPGNTTCSADPSGGLYCCCNGDSCNPASLPTYQLIPLPFLLFLINKTF